ncbi:cobalamin B12-binding domain-containing protein [Streptomyces sp. NPDC001941]|uniref:cobalamin B12-binding domain-containing protein n=1 Tax=Streptomyces sp. NPDC001941 TaxID=3154659 RepID=UPI003319B548
MNASQDTPASLRPDTDVVARAGEALWAAVRDGDEITASMVVLDLLEAGTDPVTALLDVVAPVQARVGAEWAANRLTVAQEHAATAINDRVIAALAQATRDSAAARGRSPVPVPAQGGPSLPEEPAAPGSRPPARPEPIAPSRGRITVACVDGEWHAFPARLLGEVLRLDGWRVDFLGAHTPTAHLIHHLHQTGPSAVALSSSLPTHLPTAHAAITACQAIGVPVITGGKAFGPAGRYAHLLGADAWEPDARAAARRLAEGLERPVAPPHQAVDDLPHLIDQEYTLVVKTRGDLVRETIAGLEKLYPPMRAYSAAQRRHTIEDIAHIVEFLAAALYVDDDELFTSFLTWTADILTARQVPVRSLVPALDVLEHRLIDFTRAGRVLRAGRAALDARVPDHRDGKSE